LVKKLVKENEISFCSFTFYDTSRMIMISCHNIQPQNKIDKAGVYLYRKCWKTFVTEFILKALYLGWPTAWNFNSDCFIFGICPFQLRWKIIKILAKTIQFP